ncbi:transposase [Micromonospora sp. NPDC005173]|uniref:transposase n=1 Tax=Micromonospora sp. NPDC005173 TaxID=3157165 RepID=UPI0033B711BB
MVERHIRDRKRWREFLSFPKTLRARWPGEHLYLICDNFSPHKHPEVKAWCAAHQVELVFLPTYASWLKPDRGRVRRRPLLRPQRHRPPRPRRSGQRDRRLHPVAQPTSPTQDRIRSRIQDPPPGLPLQGCMTRHWPTSGLRASVAEPDK